MGDQEGVQRLIRSFLRCPFSPARMSEVTEFGKVIPKPAHQAVGRFPEPGDEELLAGPSRNLRTTQQRRRRVRQPKRDETSESIV